MKIGVLVLDIGVISFCLGLTINSIYGVFASEFISSSIWLLLWGGAFFWLAGIIMLVQQAKENNKKTISYQKPLNPRFVNFFITLSGTIFFGTISILVFGFLFGNNLLFS